MKILLVFSIVCSLTISIAFAPSHPEYIGFDPPLKQMKQGIPPSEVICNEGLQLIMRNGGSSACVRMETAINLEERGWGVMNPPCCKGMHDVEEFSLLYTKEGGIAGIRESITIDSSEKSFQKITSQGLEEIILNDSQITTLLDSINEKELLFIGSQVYEPAEGWADYFIYTLQITSDDAESSNSWTDTKEIPEAFVEIIQHIEGIQIDTITNFEECIAAGNPAMESYPRQCRTADGKHFVEIIPGKEQCEIAGGLWGIWGNQVPVIASCNPSTSDGGKQCY